MKLTRPRAIYQLKAKGVLSMKRLRQIAEWLGVKDNDERLTWKYAQRSEGQGVYACEIVIESTLEVPA